jgi:hypothetical protein
MTAAFARPRNILPFSRNEPLNARASTTASRKRRCPGPPWRRATALRFEARSRADRHGFNRTRHAVPSRQEDVARRARWRWRRFRPVESRISPVAARCRRSRGDSEALARSRACPWWASGTAVPVVRLFRATRTATSSSPSGRFVVLGAAASLTCPARRGRGFSNRPLRHGRWTATDPQSPVPRRRGTSVSTS